jgi:medium-chain acyl-[acyl-carrier-protein] hydrolase
MSYRISSQFPADRALNSDPSHGYSKFNTWITCPSPNPAAHLRLFCLPFAGGGASIFRTWGRALPQVVEVCPIQLPGRENRLGEPPDTDVRTLAERLAGQILPYARKPFALFGHSMGALLAFELTRTLRRLGGPMPCVLFLSAHRAAHLPLRRKPLHGLPDPEFIQALRGLGGTPGEVFEHEDLLKVMLPVLRADFTLCDRYRFVPEAPLDCPLVLYAGRQDTEVSPQEIEAWNEHSTQTSRLRIFPGDHFFLRSDRDLLLRAIASTLV